MTLKHERALTLTELLVTLVLIMVIATLAVPRLLHSRIAANEATAISSVQSVVRAQAAYAAKYPTRGFAEDLARLGGTAPCVPAAEHACLIDRLLTKGAKSGYNFSASVTERSPNGIAVGYVVSAAPETYNKSGVRWFCSVSGSPVRFSANAEGRTTPPDAAACLTATPLE
jgi:type IV pilus assembly protein PilA